MGISLIQPHIHTSDVWGGAGAFGGGCGVWTNPFHLAQFIAYDL